MISSGSTPKATFGGSEMHDCEDHCAKFAGRKHPDAGKPNGNHVPDHKRAAGHPANHSKGQMPSQLNPDHGPHS